MMTGVVGAGVPLPSPAMPVEGGDAADPSGGETFLAALAAAVALPAQTPVPPPIMVVVVQPEATPTADGAVPDPGDETGTAIHVDGVPEGDAREDTPSAPRRIDLKEPSRSDVPLAEVAPRETTRDAHAATAAPSSRESVGESPRPKAARETSTGSDATEELARDESALAADPKVRLRTPGQGEAVVPAPATPSMHASAHALAAPARRQEQGSEPPAADPPSARPASATRAATPDSRRPASSASATAAGVLAAMHVARESSRAPSPALSDDAVVTVAASGAAPRPDAAREMQSAVVEPSELPTSSGSRGETIVARPVSVVAAGAEGGTGTRREYGSSAERERRPLVVPSAGATPEGAAPMQAPWMATTVPSTDTVATPVSLPGAAPTTDAPPPRVATSHVTVELDAEQSGAERVRVAVRGDVVHATVVTDRGGVEAMRPQLEQLRHALEGQGFREAHVQVRSSSGEPTGALPSGVVAEFRPRAESASRSADGSSSDQQPRGRHRGQEQSPSESRHHEHEEETP